MNLVLWIFYYLNGIVGWIDTNVFGMVGVGSIPAWEQ